MGLKAPDGGKEGLAVRQLAVGLLQTILVERRTVDDALGHGSGVEVLEPRDRAFLLTLLLSTLRHMGEIDHIISRHLSKPLPRKSGSAGNILRLAASQLVFLGTPPHAAINLAVASARADRNATHFSGLINAILRKVASEGRAALSAVDGPRLNTPEWLWARWVRAYGEDQAHDIAAEHMREPRLDVYCRDNGASWAEQLGGALLPTGQIRLPPGHQPIPELPGYAEGAWWVQDAAAGIPARLFGNLNGKSVLDLCAAPGGKTMQMAAAGAQVTAADVSEIRIGRLRENLTRTGMTAEIIVGDVLSLGVTRQFDAVLLDAPCSATGTIRRHPELPFIKSEAQIAELVLLQRKMLAAAADRVMPGGLMVYCTCSLEPEEGERHVKRFLGEHTDFAPVPASGRVPEHFISPEGWVRILPSMHLGPSQGLDGFFAVLFQRRL